MILHLLLIIFLVIMTIIAIGLTIGGLIKKRRKLWIISLSCTVVFLLGTVASGVSYAKRTIDYMSTDEFQEKTKQKAENLGRTWGNTVSGTAKGLDATIDEEVLITLANKGGKVLGGGIKAIASGVNESVTKTTIFPSEKLDNLGIEIGRAERLTDSLDVCYSLFLDIKTSYTGTLVLTAYDEDGLKMDNTVLKIDKKEAYSGVFIFKFEYLKPAFGGYCILDNLRMKRE